MLDIVQSCNPVKYQGKLMMQTWENGKKLISGPILGLHFFVSFTSTNSYIFFQATILYNLKAS